MTQVSDKKLFEYNRMGFIPGPDEEEEDYLKRVDYCLNLREHLEGKLPFGKETEGKKETLEGALTLQKELYDCSPDWIPLFISNFRLPPWHQATAWIFQMEEGSPNGALIQIRKNGSVSFDEAIAHEMCHVERMCFDEPVFEEILCWKTSKSFWRRFFSPLIQKGWEGNFFVLTLFFILVLDVFIASLGNHSLYPLMIYSKIIPLSLLGWALFRLFKSQATFERAKRNLGLISAEPMPLIFRMTDKEIKSAAKMSQEELLFWKESLKGGNLRERVLAMYMQDILIKVPAGLSTELVLG